MIWPLSKLFKNGNGRVKNYYTLKQIQPLIDEKEKIIQSYMQDTFNRLSEIKKEIKNISCKP